MTNITRRSALKMTGSTLLLLAAAGPLTRNAWAKETESVSWERFLALCHELSKVQQNNDWNQTAYTARVRKLVAKLKLDDSKIVEYVRKYENLNFDFPEIRTMHYESQFMVSMLDFEAGEDIPLHDHPDMTGVIFCTKGNVDVDHYDRLDETSASGNPLLQTERSLTMTAGDTAALTATVGNIHELRASEFTRMIDVFTPPYTKERVQRARYFVRDDSEYEGRFGIFEAEESVERV